MKQNRQINTHIQQKDNTQKYKKCTIKENKKKNMHKNVRKKKELKTDKIYIYMIQ